MSEPTPPFDDLPVTPAMIRAAHERIRPHVRRTPVLRWPELDERLGASLFFKAEHLQEAGAFKSRGACNAVFSLPEEQARRGVVTHSSGNYAAALARAARLRGVPAYIVMPHNARPAKVENVRSFGGQITFCEPTVADRERTAARVRDETGATLVHPYDDERVIAGQGTAALELLEDVPDLEVIVVPVGGGGLLAGTLVAAKSLRPEITVWAAEPRGADDAYRSWKAGRILPQENPDTVADGLRTSLGERNFAIIRRLVDDILLAGEEAILEATRRLRREAGWKVEPSGAVPLAALLEQPERARGRKVGVILSGGNIAPDENL
ncbi:MAG TPA: pyridoxal-phosphate dependent enzyme [Gemmataceae bacterium]